MTSPALPKTLAIRGLNLRVQAKHVVVDQELSVGMGAGTQAHDDAVFGALGDQLAEPVGNHLEQDHEGAGFFKGFGVVDDLLGLQGAFALDSEAAQGADGSAG